MLMQEFIQRFPETIFEGIELSKDAAVLAQQRGLTIYSTMLSDFDNKEYDIIYTVCVIEHVSSPTEFLKEIHNHLKLGGLLFLCQPTQDIQSYDLLFFDHLHHFGSEHLRQYAKKCGFREFGLVVGHEWMPNFSLHLWQAIEQPNDFDWMGPPGYTTCPSTARKVITDMARLDETLAKLAAEQRRIAVFGLGEVYWLVRAYSKLGNFPIVCGMDDQPDKSEFLRLEFPVFIPEDCLSLGIQDVILTMNKVYYDQARKRLKQLGLGVHTVLS
jgi:SAM-dependent methyltransferase